MSRQDHSDEHHRQKICQLSMPVIDGRPHPRLLCLDGITMVGLISHRELLNSIANVDARVADIAQTCPLIGGCLEC
jgi:hypothetical protein